ncbi:ATP-dependent DNA helicase RecQ [Mariprofundus micogutta]|uniref:DNA helicase RecQ n=1 Tax=Mariprofundus micogutta TaxID=1921010 RepID=A0A1L8CQY6_9PROT|nr:DNA helicase RecQ [Mariprofundus micogutta]GAV21336.1 ATP-dependent DNA helicase RecQ [Mariprofundus micogutta]
MQRAQNILKSVFGYESFRHHQADIIAALIDGSDVFTLMPTGGGKSICYQIPSLIRPGTGIVISPLIALMQDQVDAMKQLGIRAAFLNSTLSVIEQREIELLLSSGELDILYMAPERLLHPTTLSLLDNTEIALFAIDEAHCVSQWGHDFRKEYQQLSMLHERFPGVPRIALTATADNRTRAEIIAQLALDQASVFVNSFDRPNIHYAIHESGNSRDELWRFIQETHAVDSGIVYCQTRKGVETVAAWLSTKGRTALPYHAGLNQDIRQQNQQRFLREEGLIIVATIAFGMGIDKPDVRFVAHMNLPKNIEAYYQETGRAGRDGKPADAWMSYGLKDVVGLRLFTENSDAEEIFKRVMHQKTDAMLGLCELTSCRRIALLAYFGEQMTEPCDNCDNCITPPETWDATVAAQKALSCIYRTGERFGAQYVIDVLTGKSNERIENNHHDQLSTFNIGQEHTGIEWRGFFRQLITHGYLATDSEGYGVLKLTRKSWPLLKKSKTPQTVMLRKLRKAKSKKKKAPAIASDLTTLEQQLFDQLRALRALRARLAKEQNVPPYVIFPDKTLTEMAIVKPNSQGQLLDITGVGQTKLGRYGELFLTEISNSSQYSL